MRNRIYFFLLLLIFISGKQAFAGLPHLHLVDPYFNRENQTILVLRWNNAKIENGFLNGFVIKMDYGINENMTVGFDVPYLLIPKTGDAGVFGDVAFRLKFNIVQSPNLTWRLSGQIDMRIGSGVIQQDSYRRNDNGIVSYFPFTTGTHMVGITAQWA